KRPKNLDFCWEAVPDSCSGLALPLFETYSENSKYVSNKINLSSERNGNTFSDFRTVQKQASLAINLKILMKYSISLAILHSKYSRLFLSLRYVYRVNFTRYYYRFGDLSRGQWRNCRDPSIGLQGHQLGQ